MGKTTDAARGSVSNAVFESLKSAILGGAWPPGSKIPSENMLAKQFGVSRVSVRAAVQRLSSLGILESRQGGGTFVCTPGAEHCVDQMLPYFALSKTDRVNVFEFRRTIETGAVVLAAERAEGDIIQEMRQVSKQMEEAKSTDEMAEYDLKFHALVAKSTGNPIFVRIFDILSNTYRTLMKGNVEIVGTSGVSYHYMITYALEARDGELARMLMERHLDQTMIGTGEYKGSAD